MVITIIVERKKQDEEFSFADLGMFHKECCGGSFKTDGKEDEKGKVYLKCQRCGLCMPRLCPEEKIEIIKTAVDGQQRKISLEGSCSKKIDISVISKE